MKKQSKNIKADGPQRTTSAAGNPRGKATEAAHTIAEAPRTALELPMREGQTWFQAVAEGSLDASTRSALTAKQWVSHQMGPVGINEAVAVVREKADAAAAGDLAEAKRMLMAQAVALDAVFNDTLRRAALLVTTKEGGGWSYSKDAMETLTRIAFKAQGQCRATLQTLGELVNPRSVAFIKQAPGSQANVAQGQQQVNNGSRPEDSSRAGEVGSPTNKLLEVKPSERLDIGAKGAPGGANSVLEALGAVHRATH